NAKNELTATCTESEISDTFMMRWEPPPKKSTLPYDPFNHCRVCDCTIIPSRESVCPLLSVTLPKLKSCTASAGEMCTSACSCKTIFSLSTRESTPQYSL